MCRQSHEELRAATSDGDNWLVQPFVDGLLNPRPYGSLALAIGAGPNLPSI